MTPSQDVQHSQGRSVSERHLSAASFETISLRRYSHKIISEQGHGCSTTCHLLHGQCIVYPSLTQDSLYQSTLMSPTNRDISVEFEIC